MIHRMPSNYDYLQCRHASKQTTLGYGERNRLAVVALREMAFEGLKPGGHLKCRLGNRDCGNHREGRASVHSFVSWRGRHSFILSSHRSFATHFYSSVLSHLIPSLFEALTTTTVETNRKQTSHVLIIFKFLIIAEIQINANNFEF